MNTVTLQDYRDHPTLSFELHRRARRERARAIGRLFRSFAERIAEGLAALRRPALPDVRWG